MPATTLLPVAPRPDPWAPPRSDPWSARQPAPWAAPWEEADLRALADAYGAGRERGLGDDRARAAAREVYRERYPDASEDAAIEETERLLERAAARFGGWG